MEKAPTYEGGNNGNQLAHFLDEMGLLENGLTLDEWQERAQMLPHGNSNFTKWIQYDDFWEDFQGAVEDLGYSIRS